MYSFLNKLISAVVAALPVCFINLLPIAFSKISLANFFSAKVASLPINALNSFTSLPNMASVPPSINIPIFVKFIACSGVKPLALYPSYISLPNNRPVGITIDPSLFAIFKPEVDKLIVPSKAFHITSLPVKLPIRLLSANLVA